MTGLRVGVAMLAMLAAGPVWAECRPVPVVDFSASDKESSAAVSEFLRGAGDESDAAWKHPRQPAAQESGLCAVHWLAAWAKQAAWLEEIASPQAEAERAQSVAGVALAFLKIRPVASDQQREEIDGWLIQAVDLAAGKIQPGDDRRYWLGLALGAVAMAAGSERHWEAARGIASEAAREIGPDGSLKDLALQGHVAALMPLVGLATLARAQGEDFYALGDGAIDRLAGFVTKALAAQPDTKPGAGWSQLYALHAPNSAGSKIAMPRSYRGFGGDVQMLARALEPAQE